MWKKIPKTPTFRKKSLLSLFGRFLEWRRIRYPNQWNKATDLKIEKVSQDSTFRGSTIRSGGCCVTGIRVGSRTELAYAETRKKLYLKMEDVIKIWTGSKTLEEAELFLSSEGF